MIVLTISTVAVGNNIAVRIMLVIVMMRINCYLWLWCIAEQRQVSWIAGHLFRVAVTAHMLVQAHDSIGGGHDQVQIVGYQQHAALTALAYFIN